jgi:D-threo-aldose 1-dehydrogenase
VRQNLERLADTVPEALWADLADQGLVPSCA